MRGYDRGARSNPFYNPRSRDSNQDTFNYNYEYDSNGGQTYGYKDKYLYSVSQSQNKNRERAIFDDEEYYEEQVKEPVQKYGEFKKYIEFDYNDKNDYYEESDRKNSYSDEFGND